MQRWQGNNHSKQEKIIAHLKMTACLDNTDGSGLLHLAISLATSAGVWHNSCSLASQSLFFFLVRGEEEKKKKNNFSQVFVGLSQNVGTADQITSVS